MDNIDVIIADDHVMIREALTDHVNQLSYTNSVRQASHGKEVLALVKESIPDVILMDIQMPEMDGIECSRILFDRYPDIKIIALTAIENPMAMVRMLELGVQGYCLKNMELEELDNAIVAVIENDFYQNELVVKVMRNERISSNGPNIGSHQYTVTDRDIKILKLLTQEKTAKEIGEEIYLSPRTVEKIRNELARNLEVRGVVGLVRYAIKHGYDI